MPRGLTRAGRAAGHGGGNRHEGGGAGEKGGTVAPPRSSWARARARRARRTCRLWGRRARMHNPARARTGAFSEAHLRLGCGGLREGCVEVDWTGRGRGAREHRPARQQSTCTGASRRGGAGACFFLVASEGQTRKVNGSDTPTCKPAWPEHSARARKRVGEGRVRARRDGARGAAHECRALSAAAIYNCVALPPARQ